jgi:hypothetical protein
VHHPACTLPTAGRGEAVALALLGSAEEKSPALAVVRGTAVNQDGRSSSLTAPNGPAQSVLIAAALQSAQTSGSLVELASLHGTGTPLGDPIEVSALSAALGGSKQAGGVPRALHLASSKVRVQNGHCCWLMLLLANSPVPCATSPACCCRVAMATQREQRASPACCSCSPPSCSGGCHLLLTCGSSTPTWRPPSLTGRTATPWLACH